MNNEKYQQIKKEYSLLVGRVDFSSMDDIKEPKIISGENLTYNYNNGVVSFIDEEGISYVTPFYEIIKTLEQAGYKQAGLFVPFSDNKWLNNGVVAFRWKTLVEREKRNRLENIDLSEKFNIEDKLENNKEL